MNDKYTILELKNKLDELIERGYGDLEFRVTYDLGHGATGIGKNTKQFIHEAPMRAYSYALFVEDDYVEGKKLMDDNLRVIH